jgi:tRNA pseudouridine55 synthase
MWDFVEGEVLAFDKPLHWTSFDLVAKVRYALCRKLECKKLKVGHSGTLDPLATGVVIVCTGKKTKLIESLQYDVKEYEATLQLGATTASYDMEQPINATYPTEHIDAALIHATIPSFVGEQWQIPPVYSAVWVNGKRAYEFARQGQEVELKPKLLVIDTIEVLNFDIQTMQLTIRVVCSKGTYIRALARDIGERLNSGAYLTALRRTRVGNIKVQDCYSIDEFLSQLKEYEYV